MPPRSRPSGSPPRRRRPPRRHELPRRLRRSASRWSSAASGSASRRSGAVRPPRKPAGRKRSGTLRRSASARRRRRGSACMTRLRGRPLPTRVCSTRSPSRRRSSSRSPRTRRRRKTSSAPGAGMLPQRRALLAATALHAPDQGRAMRTFRQRAPLPTRRDADMARAGSPRGTDRARTATAAWLVRRKSIRIRARVTSSRRPARPLRRRTSPRADAGSARSVSSNSRRRLPRRSASKKPSRTTRTSRSSIP